MEGSVRREGARKGSRGKSPEKEEGGEGVEGRVSSGEKVTGGVK